MRNRYEGVCYDGPHEGRSYSQEYSDFRVAMYQPLNCLDYWSVDKLQTCAEVRTGSYRWSNPLRKWVWWG